MILLRLLIFSSFILFFCDDTSTPHMFELSAKVSTEHFTLHFREGSFCKQYVEYYAQRKEKLLRHINNYLQVNFNDHLEVYLYGDGSRSYFKHDKACHEVRFYISDDSGHEIAHAVTYNEIGDPGSRFFLEGIAVACEYYHDFENALDYFLNKEMKSSPPLNKQSMLLKIGNNAEFSIYDYDVAGAFVHYIINRYGIDKFKSFYSQNCPDDITLIRTLFFQAYKMDIDSTVGEFVSYCSPKK